MNEPKLISGGVACDDRGSLSFVNEFDFQGVKRFYQVENISKDVVRAFHGHLKEGKYVYVPKGSIKLFVAKLDDDGGMMKDIHCGSILSSKKPSIFWIPPRYANGFKALEEGTIVQFFSTTTLKESEGDDYRFGWDHFGADLWKTENR